MHGMILFPNVPVSGSETKNVLCLRRKCWGKYIDVTVEWRMLH